MYLFYVWHNIYILLYSFMVSFLSLKLFLFYIYATKHESPGIPLHETM